MQRQQLRELLQEVSFSADLPSEVLDAIAASAIVLDLPCGTVVFREGTENFNLYLLCEGSVSLEMCVPARGCIRFMSLGPGDMFGWSALLGQGQMTATATVEEDAQVIAIPSDRLLDICDTFPSVGYHLMRRMAHSLSQRLLATRLQMLDLFSTESPAING
jgi:CRP/FNR family transcriptional regulator, cyclic AMP receptor protein